MISILNVFSQTDTLIIAKAIAIDEDNDDGVYDAIEIEFSIAVHDGDISGPGNRDDWEFSLDPEFSSFVTPDDFSTNVYIIADQQTGNDKYIRFTFNPKFSSNNGPVYFRYTQEGDVIWDQATESTDYLYDFPLRSASDSAAPVINNLTPNEGSGDTLIVGDKIIFTIDFVDPIPNPNLTILPTQYNGGDLNWSTSNNGNTYVGTYIVEEGHTNQKNPLNLVDVTAKDQYGNISDSSEALITKGIDANTPFINNVSSSPTSVDTLIINGTITFTVDIDVDDASLTILPEQYNGQNLNWNTSDLGSTYKGIYTVIEGDQDRGIPVQLTGVKATDPAGNISNSFTGSDVVVSIDANKPSISSISFSPGSGTVVGIGGAIDVIITSNDLETDLSANSIIINGVTILNEDVTNEGDGTYSFTYNIGATDASVLDSDPILIDFKLEDAAGNISASYISSTAAKCPGIDNSAPIITNLALSTTTGTLGIGDTLIFTVTASEAGLVPSTISINSKDLKNKVTAIGGGNYEIEYIIKSGDNPINDASQAIPVSFILTDAAGNPSNEFNTLNVANSPGIDAVRPIISIVNVTPVTMLYNHTYTVNIIVDSDGGDNYIIESGSIAGFNFYNLQRNSNVSYSLDFTVGNLGYDILSGDSYSISNLLFSDQGGNFSNTYSATVTQVGDPIYTILPTAKVKGKHYVCDGNDANLSFQLTGSSPWSIELFNGTGTTTVGSINESPFTYSIQQNLSVSTEPDTIVYKITEVTDANGNVKMMTGTDSSIVYVRVVPTVSFVNPAGDKTYNINAEQDSLIGNPPATSGGMFSGDGVIPSNNKFFPSAAGLGVHEILYTYTDPSSSCYSSDTVELTVIASNASITIDDGDYLRCDYETTFDVTASVVYKPLILGEIKMQNVSAGTITDHGNNTATVDVQNLSAGTYTLYFVYDDAGVDSVSNSFTVESVSTPNFTELFDLCADYETINIDAYNLIPTGGTGEFIFSGPAGAFIYDSSVEHNSGYLEPEIIPAGSYSLDYIYTSPNGCESQMVTKNFDVNALPTVSFTMNSVYNIDQGSSTIVGDPADANGVFTPLSFMSNNGNGTADFDPADAGLGNHWIKYTYQDANSCVNADSMEILINKALGDITSSTGSFQYCYYGSSVATFTGTPNPTDGTPGSFYIDNILIEPESDNTILFNPQNYTAGDHQVRFEYSNGVTNYVVYETVNIDLIENIYFTGLDSKYCENENKEVELTASYAGLDGLMKYTGPGITDDVVDNLGYFNPSKAILGNNIITYTFTRDYSGCQKVFTKTVTINKTPTVAFYPNEHCVASANSLLGFTSDTLSSDSIISWEWKFRNIYTSNEQSPQFPPSLEATNRMQLTLETNKGCSQTVDSSFYIGTRVDLQFSFENECQGDVGEFTMKVSSNPDDVLYHNWDFGGVGVSDLSDSLNPTYKYTNPGGYDVIYEEFTKSCGRIADTLKVNIRPSIDLSTRDYMTDFEDEPDITGWVIEDYELGSNAANSWQWGIPAANKINDLSSGNHAYVTNLSGNYQNNEMGMITSPCFDFSNTNRPMMTFDFKSFTENEKDGAVLQYYENGDWLTLGVNNDGINWYNWYLITARPAGSNLGWTGQISSENNDWETAMYRLDELRGRAGVRFRIVFGSTGDGVDEGFAFDNIRFSERKRTVLLENFTNNTVDNAVNTLDDINNKLIRDSLDLITLNYYAGFPNTNTFNSFYPSGPSARALFYGVSNVPYSVLDGGERQFDYLIETHQLTENDVHKRMLIEPKFEISVQQDIQNNNFVVSSNIKALEEFFGHHLIVYVAVVEKTILDASNNAYYNVLRTMLPDAAGILVDKNWMIGDEVNIYQTWSVPETVNTDSLTTIVFAQDEDSKEIYQTAYTQQYSNITAINDILNENAKFDFSIFPNPVNELLSINLINTLNYDLNVLVYNNVGSLLKTAKIMSGYNSIIINTEDLPSGIYIIKLTNSGKNFGTKKFIKTE